MREIKFRYSCSNFFGKSVINVDDSLSDVEIIENAKKQVKEGHRNPTLTELEQCYTNKCKLSITIQYPVKNIHNKK